VPRTQERRPDQRYTDIRIVDNMAESWYHAGQLEWEMGEYHGLSGRMTYTYGKALDTGAEPTDQGGGDVQSFPLRPGELTYAKGFSRFDVRHRFTLATSYSFPWLMNRNDWMGSAFGGWTISAVARYASGTPFTIIDSAAPDVLFLGSQQPFRPVCVDPNYCSGELTSSSQNGSIPLSAFRHAQYGDTLSDFIGRNTYRADGSESVDAGLYKTFRLSNNIGFMIRFDVFNVFNTARWWYPGNDISTPLTFGRVTQTAYSLTASPSSAPNALSPPRTMQLGFRLMF
jgi:hypothetical protein